MGAEIIRFLRVTLPIFNGLNRCGNFLCKQITLSKKSFWLCYIFMRFKSSRGRIAFASILVFALYQICTARRKRADLIIVNKLTQLGKISNISLDRGAAIQYTVIDNIILIKAVIK